MPEKKLPLIISSGWFMVWWPSVSAAGRKEKWILLVATSVQEGGWKNYLETDSIIALEQVTMTKMNS